jgi:membrane protein YdbS with pleckstrin-like domain
MAGELELAEGEVVEFSTNPAKTTSWLPYLLTLGLYEFWRRAHVWAVTDRRVAERRGVLIFKSEKSLPLFYVQDATLETFLWWARVTVSTAGGDASLETTNYVSKENGRRLRSEILDRAHAIRQQQTGAGTPLPPSAA